MSGDEKRPGEPTAGPVENRGGDSKTVSELSLVNRILWWLGRPAARGVFIVVAAVVVYQVMQPEKQAVLEEPALEIKDNISLTVYRSRGASENQVNSADEFKAGDRLRFEVATPRIGNLLLLGRNSSGKAYAIYPPDTQGKATLKQPGRDALRGLFEVSERNQFDTLYAILCHRIFHQNDIDVTGDGVQTPKDCYVAEFKLNKAP